MENKIINKVQKLLAVANGSAEGGEHERDTAMKMALSLLAKHNLSMSDCEIKTEDRLLEEDLHDVCPWRRTAANAIAKLFFCHFFSSKIQGKQKLKFSFIGLESNVLTTKEMTKWIIKSVHRESAIRRKELDAPASFATSFCNAAAIQITKRCMEIRKQAELDSQTASSGTDLVLASIYDQEESANKDYISNKLGIKLIYPKGLLKNINNDGAKAGWEYGKTVNLSKQISGSSKNAVKIN